MIDKRKNFCYHIEITYLTLKDGVSGRVKFSFLSQHDISSKRCKEYIDARLKKNPDYWQLDEDWGTQRTIKNSEVCL